MKALTANLATRPFRNNTVIGSIVTGVAVGLLVATIYNLYIFLSYGSSYALLLDDQDRNRTKLEELEVEERSLVKQIEARDFETAFDRGSVANELILKRTFSWTELFNKMEGLIPPAVMMSAIRPNVSSSVIVIRVEGVAKTHSAFLDLQENLLAHKAFSAVYPASIRRLNPSRPEITFILNFDYRQSERTPGDMVVAEATAQQEPPAAAAAVGGSGGVPPATGVAAAGDASARSAILRAAVAAEALPVGRDGRPRTLEVIARRMVAPGGVYDPPPLVLPQAAVHDARRGAVKQATVASSSAQQAAATAADAKRGTSRAATPDLLPQSDSSARAEASSPSPNAGTPPPPAAQADVPPPAQSPAAATPGRSRLMRRRQTPAGATGSTRGGAQPGGVGAVPGAATPLKTTPVAGEPTDPQAAAVPSAQPAERLDLSLDFANRPVPEVYRLLGKAHGVRFVVDAAIDRKATLNVNLGGRSLPDVIATMADVANHRITQLRPGIYQVVAISEGDSLIEPEVEEENLPATEGAP